MNSIVRIMPSPNANNEPLAPDFRAAMRHLVGGVSVITVGRAGETSGMTVTSVSSLSIEPASLIVSVNRSASSWPILQRERAFGVNILAADQLEIAERFAGKGGIKGAERFAGAEWQGHVTGVPLLVGALAAFDCEVEDIIERHSHALVIGKVLHVEAGQAAAALAYWHGDYLAVDRDEDMLKLATMSVPNPQSTRQF